MTTVFVSRHPGALQWAKAQGVDFDRHVPHLDLTDVAAGDVVIGTLPVQLAAQVCERGAHYFHLTMSLPHDLRGNELTGAQLAQLGARLQRFEVRAVTGDPAPGLSSTID